jgi:hypothetical protein
MKSSQLKYCNDKLSQWCIIITLIVSIFSTSGYSKNSTSLYKQKAQTELVCSTSTKPNKPTFAFKNTISISHKNIFVYNPAAYKTAFLLAYNNLIKVRLVNISKRYHSIERVPKYLQLKNFTDNSGKDTFISIG